MSTKLKKIIVFQWVFGLILMTINEIIAIATYFEQSKSEDYNDRTCRNILLIFIVVNILDFLFWLFGLMTLHY